MKGDVPVSQIKINDVMDSAAYRQMLADLSAQIKAGKCLSVHAIDAPGSVPDAALARRGAVGGRGNS